MGNHFIGGDLNQIHQGNGQLRLAYDLFIGRYNLFDTAQSEETDSPEGEHENGTFRMASGRLSLLDGL